MSVSGPSDKNPDSSLVFRAGYVLVVDGHAERAAEVGPDDDEAFRAVQHRPLYPRLRAPVCPVHEPASHSKTLQNSGIFLGPMRDVR